MPRLRVLGLGLLLGSASLLCAPGSTSAAPDKPSAANADRKLPELPAPPSLETARPDATTLAEVDALLSRIVADDAQDRDGAMRELLEAEPKQVSAIRFRLGAIADGADKEAMKRVLLKTRRELLDKKDDEEESDKPTAGLDYLARLVQKPEPKSEAWQKLTSVLALSRMLESIGTVEAVRGLVDVYARFGEFLRITTQNALARLGDRAVPALIEAERHPAEKIAKWAVRQLDGLGKGVPAEAVQTQDQAVLADVLRAYGRTRNPDAVRIVVSFANSERAQIREASRQAVALMGEVSSWQLRDTYENVVGKKPPRDWAWERTARELFAEFDRLRFAQVGKFFEDGQAARAKGDLAAMRESFDKLLAYDPNFDQKTELAAGYVAFAKANQDKSRDQAIAALRRAERLDPTLKDATSLRLTLEAETLEDQGVTDSTLLERALEANAGNGRAKSAQARFERGEPKRSEKARWIAAGSIMALAAGALAFILLRKPKPAEPKPEEPKPPTSAEPEELGAEEPKPAQPEAEEPKPAEPDSADEPPPAEPTEPTEPTD